MGSVLARNILFCCLIAAATGGGATATLADNTPIMDQLALNTIAPAKFTKLMCFYSTGSVTHRCDLTETGAQAKVGLPCYCGHSPKGIIRSVPLLFSSPY